MRSSTRKRRRRFVRPLAIASSAIAFAAPASAGAMMTDSTLPVTPAQDQAGARLDHRGLNDVQAPPYVTTVHVKSAGDDGNRTLAIVLASSALGVALCGGGYAALSITRTQRRLGVEQ